MTLPMYTLVSETLEQLAFSLPEPASNCDTQSEANGQRGARLVTVDLPLEPENKCAHANQNIKRVQKHDRIVS